MKVNALVMRTAGTNCDRETELALRLAGARTQRLHINRIREEPGRLAQFDLLFIPGGFSYGDDLGAGTILANELAAILRRPLRDFIRAGKLIIGICNGFQVLVKTGLLPAFEPWEREVTLTINDSRRFEDRWVRLEGAPNRSKIVMEDDRFFLPVAHAEGKFTCRDSSVLKRLVENGQVIFRYSGPRGGPPGYPCNPNGSVDDIAGICDTTGQVIGMMPHPERYSLPHQHPAWTREGAGAEGDGLLIFRRAVEYAAREKNTPVRT